MFANNWILADISRTCSEIISLIFLQFFSEKYKNKQTFLWSYCTEPHQSCTRCSHIQCASKLPIGVPILQSMAGRQRIFSDCRWLTWQRPLSNRQTNAKFMKPLHSSTNPWKVDEDRSSSSWELVAPRSTTKITKKTLAKYIARRASMPGGLNWTR